MNESVNHFSGHSQGIHRACSDWQGEDHVSVVFQKPWKGARKAIAPSRPRYPFVHYYT